MGEVPLYIKDHPRLTLSRRAPLHLQTWPPNAELHDSPCEMNHETLDYSGDLEKEAASFPPSIPVHPTNWDLSRMPATQHRPERVQSLPDTSSEYSDLKNNVGSVPNHVFSDGGLQEQCAFLVTDLIASSIYDKYVSRDLRSFILVKITTHLDFSVT